ncbi:hypothetical protein COU60_02205 [Candidatus Pacearchaeota archaeon CG10_big_fil_rev_8_21_14_0_10_34_76]|nr:MAG: hypothetical protein COU60_02205 [Candidatus Pacearchaeota archaeon CG10_big_fil_rev_8_21_14_0_10_34_76]
MSFFKKRRGNEIIDYTDLQRRGLLKKEQEMNSMQNYSGEVVDLTPINYPKRTQENQTMNSSDHQNSSSGSDNFDFLSGFAQASVSSNESVNSLNSSSSGVSSSGSITDSLRVARRENKDHLRTEINELKIKLDDSNYKIDILMEKVRELERLKER